MEVGYREVRRPVDRISRSRGCGPWGRGCQNLLVRGVHGVRGDDHAVQGRKVLQVLRNQQDRQSHPGHPGL